MLVTLYSEVTKVTNETGLGKVTEELSVGKSVGNMDALLHGSLITDGLTIGKVALLIGIDNLAVGNWR